MRKLPDAQEYTLSPELQKQRMQSSRPTRSLETCRTKSSSNNTQLRLVRGHAMGYANCLERHAKRCSEARPHTWWARERAFSWILKQQRKCKPRCAEAVSQLPREPQPGTNTQVSTPAWRGHLHQRLAQGGRPACGTPFTEGIALRRCALAFLVENRGYQLRKRMRAKNMGAGRQRCTKATVDKGKGARALVCWVARWLL